VLNSTVANKAIRVPCNKINDLRYFYPQYVRKIDSVSCLNERILGEAGHCTLLEYLLFVVAPRKVGRGRHFCASIHTYIVDTSLIVLDGIEMRKNSGDGR
jgi:hypothetical protein